MKYRISMFQFLLLLTFLFYSSILINMDKSRYFQPNETRKISTTISNGGISGESKSFSSISSNPLIRIVYWVYTTIALQLNGLTQNIFGLAFLIIVGCYSLLGADALKTDLKPNILSRKVLWSDTAILVYLALAKLVIHFNFSYRFGWLKMVKKIAE